MSVDNETCPSCGGPMTPHEETLIWLGHPDRVRYRYRCDDPGCAGSFAMVVTG